MERLAKLEKQVANVRIDHYDLRSGDLLALHDRFHDDLFGLISFVFKLGFARGQKAVKKA